MGRSVSYFREDSAFTLSAAGFPRYSENVPTLTVAWSFDELEHLIDSPIYWHMWTNPIPYYS